ncbi:hypothetical protein EJ04DRAFT_511984, partial [Polyplosphaeria fusca]
MASGDLIDDDDYVANLLKKDAKIAAKRYDLVGLGAFLPTRPTDRAPKPNTRFLRHIIRETDNHNAALLAKEADESRARLQRMNQDADARLRDGRSDNDRRPGKRKRHGYYDGDTETDHERSSKRYREREPRDSTSKRDRERERGRQRATRHDDSNDDYNANSPRSRRDHDSDRRHRRNRDKEQDARDSRRSKGSHHRHRRERLHSPSSPRDRSPASRSHRSHKSSKPRRRSPRSPSLSRSRSRTPVRKSPDSPLGQSRKVPRASHTKRTSHIDASDSDPLESIVGPIPPAPRPDIRTRGRGAHKTKSSAMDARFSDNYNPSTDVRIDSDVEDDWGDQLERFRDHQRWKQVGAERLLQAGFSNDQVKKWEKGDEKTEEDVQWSSKGAAREWDRGKVVGDDGDVELQANWGRL